MRRWEYAVRVLEPDGESIETALASLGLNGWELVSAVPTEDDQLLVILKRPAPGLLS